MSALKSKDARLKLHRKMVKAGNAGDISWESIGKGRSVGYRRLEGSACGNWYARKYDRNRAGSPYHRHAIGTADDVGVANGEDILDFNQALTKSSSFDPWASPDTGDAVATVGGACRVYLEWSEHNRPKTHRVIKSNFNCHVFGDEIASIPVSRLTVQHLERWKRRVSQKPRGHVSGTLEAAANADELRSRRANANRPIAWVKAALSHCKETGAITVDDSPWRLLKKFTGVDRSGRRGQPPYLTSEQVASLFEAIDDQCFLHLVQAAIFTGARYSELGALRVADFDPDNGTLTVKDGKGSKKRNIFLGNNATRLFALVCEGRQSDERIFLKTNGSKWGNNHAQRPLQRAREAAGIPHFSFHVLRHSYCSLYLMAGGNEFDLMKQLGHSTTQQISANYGHLANQHRQDEAKACEPTIPDIATTEATLH